LIEHIQYYHQPETYTKKDAKEPSQVSSPTNPISYNANNPAPEKSKIVLHCSAGIGRTGTILAIYNIVQSLKIL